MESTTPPVLQGPSSKEKKYDRQLRLWAASGQQALEDAHILLVNNGPGVVGVETLKNLILPGIGHFTILDSHLVKEEDLGVNFFLEDDSLGDFRAKHLCKYLNELNPDVQGHFKTEPLETFLDGDDALSPYSLIIASAPLNPEFLEKISTHRSRTATPIFYVHSVGFYGLFSVVLPASFPIVDTHPDPATISDLRLLVPWPALSEFAKQKTLEIQTQSDDDHGHIPYVLLLLHYLEEWKLSHDGKPPQNYREKSEFRELVRGGARTNTAEGGEENFDEAVGAVLKSLNPPELSSGVKEVFAADECKDITDKSPNFWIIARAISRFHSEHGSLPLPGSVPDMKARSADYIKLQNIYKTKAREDLAEVLSIVRNTEKQLGRTKHIEEKEVEAFCKGAAHIKLVRGRPFHIARPDNTIQWGERVRFAFNALSNPDSLLPLYIAFLAWDSFFASHDHPPGEHAADPDDGKLIGIVHKYIDDLIKEAGETIEEPEYSEVKERASKYAKELVRAGGGELHNISALTGGLVSQEVIKVVTQQYIPVENTCIFDGIFSKSEVLRL